MTEDRGTPTEPQACPRPLSQLVQVLVAMGNPCSGAVPEEAQARRLLHPII